VSLRDVLEPDATRRDVSTDPVQVVVFNDGDRSVGMMVDEIVDVAEEAVTVRKKSDRKGILGSAIVGKRVTDFLDLNEVIHASEGNWAQGADETVSRKCVLVADPSAFSRGMIRSGLEMAGYVIYEAANLDEAVHRLERQAVDVVALTLDLPPEGSSALLAAMRAQPEWEKIPVLALAESAAQIHTPAVQTAGFQDCQIKSDPVRVLESVARLVSPLPAVEAMLVCAGEER
jgi:two-component system chemotaxis sensor kinase CheA